MTQSPLRRVCFSSPVLQPMVHRLVFLYTIIYIRGDRQPCNTHPQRPFDVFFLVLLHRWGATPKTTSAPFSFRSFSQTHRLLIDPTLHARNRCTMRVRYLVCIINYVLCTGCAVRRRPLCTDEGWFDTSCPIFFSFNSIEWFILTLSSSNTPPSHSAHMTCVADRDKKIKNICTYENRASAA